MLNYHVLRWVGVLIQGPFRLTWGHHAGHSYQAAARTSRDSESTKVPQGHQFIHASITYTDSICCDTVALIVMGPLEMVRVAVVYLFVLCSSVAHAEKRVALVIGNGAYANVPKLNNATNDATEMETMFKAAGFDTVVRANDLGVAAMRRALRDFSNAAHDADVAVVFYAGHGIEVSGTNYLIPIDAVLERDIDARDEAVSLVV